MPSSRRPWCRIDDRIVVLDRDNSRYRMIRPADAGRPDDFDEQEIPAARTGGPDEPAGDGPLAGLQRWRMLQLMFRLRRCEVRCARTMRRGGIDAGLAMLERSPTGPADEDRADAMVSAALHASLWWSARDRCLPRSIALAIELRRLGSDAKLIIGVALDPFAAHAWVQSGDCALNDTLDHIRLFTPILAI